MGGSLQRSQRSWRLLHSRSPGVRAVAARQRRRRMADRAY